MSDITTTENQLRPIDQARHELERMEPQFKAALPAHIPAERFARVGMTAIQNNPDLLKCDRRSLWNAMMRAAQDGLLPDGRDGAIVAYKGKAQWMPMIGGIRKKVRNSGEISTWDVQCVYQNDQFDFELGDEPFIRHKPALTNRGSMIAAYSVAKLKDGSLSREVMSIEEIEGVRGKSKAEFGPWNDPVFYPEMVRKTVARRHSKLLPMSSDLDDLIRRDDELYDLAGARAEAAKLNGGKPQTLAGKLDNLAALPAPAAGAEQPAKPENSRDALIAEIETLPAGDPAACTAWWGNNGDRCNDLTEMDYGAVVKALMARQKPRAEPAKEAAQDNADDPFAIPAQLRRGPNDRNGRAVFAAG